MKLLYGDRVKTACGTFDVDQVESVYRVPERTIYVMVSDYGLRGELDKPLLTGACNTFTAPASKVA